MYQLNISSAFIRLAQVGIACVVVFSSAALVGCSGPRDGPRDRLGALPFPGTFTLYAVADPTRLGEHRYERTPRLLRPDETERGIVYTTRAGFLDLAHVRITIDTVRFCARRVHAAIEQGRTEIALPTLEGSRFLVSLNYPPGWSAASADPRVVEELSIRTGQRLAYLMMTWHEVITWFGYRTVIFVDEQPSSFTYDDTMSHVIGLRVAGRALRDTSGSSFDDAVTFALREELAAEGAEPPDQTQLATHAVEGRWWAHGRPLKRQLDVGLEDDEVTPWLVHASAAFTVDATPEPFQLPTLHDVFGRDYTGFYSVRIDPEIPEAPLMRAVLPTHPRLFDGERDMPLLIETVRAQMRQIGGPNIDQPWPVPRDNGPIMVQKPQQPSAAPPPSLFVSTHDHSLR